jgi:hypothetical protein
LKDADNFYAVGHAQIRITGSMRTDGESASASFEVELYKDWNFDKGEVVHGIELGQFAGLHEWGLAQEYVLTSVSGGFHYSQGKSNF